jgi:putative hydrolases of HD superfamily
MESAQAAKALYVLMTLVADLKNESRDGWNRFPRRVYGAESVADHSYGIAMMAMTLNLLAPHLRMDHYRLVCLCLVHDLVEAKTGDINIYVEKDPNKKAILRAMKKRSELEAVGYIRDELGEDLGPFVFNLWMEFEECVTFESKIAHELDAIEAVFQSLWYYEQGYQVDPCEFYNTARPKVSTPELVCFMEKEIFPRMPKL